MSVLHATEDPASDALPEYLTLSLQHLSDTDRRSFLPAIPEQFASQMLLSVRLRSRLCTRLLAAYNLSLQKLALPKKLEVLLTLILRSAQIDLATDLGLSWNSAVIASLLANGQAGPVIEDHGRDRILAALAFRRHIIPLDARLADSDRPLVRADVGKDGRACLHAWISRLPLPVQQLTDVIAPHLIDADLRIDANDPPRPHAASADMADLTQIWLEARLAAGGTQQADGVGGHP